VGCLFPPDSPSSQSLETVERSLSHRECVTGDRERSCSRRAEVQEKAIADAAVAQARCPRCKSSSMRHLLDAVHLQALVVDTVTDPAPSLPNTLSLVGEIEYVHAGGGDGGGGDGGGVGAGFDACVTIDR
jgi:hypothetical protein